MVFLVESVLACAAFTLFVFLISRDPVKTVFNYPPAIIERCRQLGLVDAINRTLGPGTVLFGVQGDGRFHMTQEHKSPHYTTLWSDIPKASVK